MKPVSRFYIKATIYTTTQGAEALAPLLSAYGIESYSVEDPADLDFIIASKDKLAWDFIGMPLEHERENGEVRVVFWLDAAEDGSEGAEAAAILGQIRIGLMKLKSDEQYGVFGERTDFGRLWLDTESENDDWKYKYKESFHAFSPVDGYVIVPPWEADDVSTGAENLRGDGGDMIRIIIDPGMAFGTGSHETTSMCLAGLSETLKPGDLALDAGTGSGILAIAAASLHADHVYAVELDMDAAASAAGNIAANDAGEKISLITGDITKEGILPADICFDVITANLSCPLLESLLPVFKGLLAKDGLMILSGLLDTQEDRMLKALAKEALMARNIVKNNEWLMIEVCR